jgi:hypothetical protein
MQTQVFLQIEKTTTRMGLALREGTLKRGEVK